MPRVQTVDKSGHTTPSDYVDGWFFAPSLFDYDTETHLDIISNLEMRDDDVVMCVYPKCGTHWAWEMIQMLIAGRVTYDARIKESLMLDFMTKEKLDALPSPRTLNTHFLFRHLPKQVALKKTKTIFIVRDPRDVCVSLYQHNLDLVDKLAYKGSFSDFLPIFQEGALMFGSWFEYVKDCERVEAENPDHDFLTLYYEEMKKDTTGTVKQLSAFLGRPAGDELCKDIAEACGFQNLKDAHHREKDDILKFAWKDISEEHPGIYRKG